MLSISFTGKIFSVETGEFERNGNTTATTAIKFTITQRVKETDKASEKFGEYVYKSIWCRAVAYDKTAEYWADFEKDDQIAGTGTFEVQAYVRKEGDKKGQADFSLEIRGQNTSTPTIQKLRLETDDASKSTGTMKPKTYGKGKAKDDSDDEGFFKG